MNDMSKKAKNYPLIYALIFVLLFFLFMAIKNFVHNWHRWNIEPNDVNVVQVEK